MSEKYKFYDPDGTYFVTFTITGWIDLFTRRAYVDILLEILRTCISKYDLKIHCWCLMPSHFHAIVSCGSEKTLSSIIRIIKSTSSQKIIRAIFDINESRRDWMLATFKDKARSINRNRQYKIWQDGSHPICLESEEIYLQKLDYIHDNPVVSGFVDEEIHWKWSSARDFEGGQGELEITILDYSATLCRSRASCDPEFSESQAERAMYGHDYNV